MPDTATLELPLFAPVGMWGEPPQPRAVLTGGRYFADIPRIELDVRGLIAHGLRRLAQGGNRVPRKGSLRKPARSADAIGHFVVRLLVEEGVPLDIDGDTYWADWEAHGISAGQRRNVAMLEAERPSLVLAYPDAASEGTWRCVEEALRRGIPVSVWHPGQPARRPPHRAGAVPVTPNRTIWGHRSHPGWPFPALRACLEAVELGAERPARST